MKIDIIVAYTRRYQFGHEVDFVPPVTHRIYGPLIPILRHFRVLNAGDYASRVQLPGKYQLGEIAEALKKLAATLEKKKL